MVTALSTFFLSDDLRLLLAAPVVFMGLALVGLATGLGARYPRFRAENITQVAGSYGGVMFMIGAVLFLAVMIVLVGWPSSTFLWHRFRRARLSHLEQALMAASFLSAAALSLATWWLSMRSGVRALQRMDRTPA